MESRDVDLGWCAGFFDGEGCFSTSRGKTPPFKWHCEIFVGNTHLPSLERFQKIVGTGSINRRQDLWMFQAATAKAVHVVRQILPFMCAKREQAELFLDFAYTFSKHNKKPTSTETLEVREKLDKAISALKKEQTSTFHKNGVNSVKPELLGNTEPSRGFSEGVQTTGLPAQSAPPSREDIVGYCQ